MGGERRGREGEEKRELSNFLFFFPSFFPFQDVQPQGIICLHKATCTVKGKRELSISSESSKRVYEMKVTTLILLSLLSFPHLSIFLSFIINLFMKADTEENRNKWSSVLNEVASSKLSLPDMQDGAQIVANCKKVNFVLVIIIFILYYIIFLLHSTSCRSFILLI